MLDELHVRNIALIEDATIQFAPGLTVLTGETGAGKTALLSALELICGRRADSGVVRDGASEALAEARFVGDAEDGEEHVVRRRLSAAGRSRCTIDGSMSTVAELARASSSISIHSQHEQVLLLQPAAQLSYLDAWIDPQGAHMAPYRQARGEYLAAKRRLEQMQEASNTAARELEFARFTASEIGKVDPREGEYEELEGELPRLQHGEDLALAVNEALSALHRDGAALDLLAEALGALERERGIDDELDGLIERLAGLDAELEDLARDLAAYVETVQYDPRRLQDVLGRLEALSGLMKRFGPGMRQVLEAQASALRTIRDAQASPQQLDAAREACEKARAAYEEEATALSAVRHEAAARFCAQLSQAVQELAMEGAGFGFSFEELAFEKWGAAGSESAELLYRPAPASKARPLARIASGGELSRILLALECIYHGAAGNEDRVTIVFDEVDSGIGGATGAAVARRLAQLSRHAQVIVVTHLAQVAARADEQYVVSKSAVEDGLPVTSVERVEGEARVAEIARMLAGEEDATALDHARALIAGGDRV